MMMSRAALLGAAVILFFAVSALEAITTVGSTEATMTTREPAVAGAWYEADRSGLRAQVEKLLASAKPPALPGRPVAVIAPHAGYAYSGRGAALALSALLSDTTTHVIVIGPSHHYSFEGFSVPTAGRYRTPLGEIAVDPAMRAEMLAHPLCNAVPEAHAREHSVEAEVPFLQVLAPKAAFLPVIVGQIDTAGARSLGERLRRFLEQDGHALVISSDFAHLGPAYGTRSYSRKEMEAHDRLFTDAICAKDPTAFARLCGRFARGAPCGRHAIATMLAALPMDAQGQVLGYYTSGDVARDYTNAVGYASIVFTVPRDRIGPDGQRALLREARATLRARFDGKDHPPLATIPRELAARRGAFVTLKKDGRLRGCIGTIIPRQSLYAEVVTRVVSSAFEDRRFEPLAEDELDEIEIEISVLSVPTPVARPEDVVVGLHGVILEKGNRGAVYLPQVAPEQGWSREDMLSHLSIKAGLPGNAWKKGAKISVFTAQVFSERMWGD